MVVNKIRKASSLKPYEVITLYDTSDDEQYDDRNSMVKIDNQRRRGNRRNVGQKRQVKKDVMDLTIYGNELINHKSNPKDDIITIEDDEHHEMYLNVSMKELPEQRNINDSTYPGAGDRHQVILNQPMQKRSNHFGEGNQESNSLPTSKTISKSLTQAVNRYEQNPAQKSHPSTIEVEENQVQSSAVNTPFNEIENLGRLEKENETQRRQCEEKLQEVVAEGQVKKMENKRPSSGAASSQRMSAKSQLPHHGQTYLSQITSEDVLVEPQFGSQGSIISETTSRQNNEHSPQEYTSIDISNFPVDPNFNPLDSLSKDQFTDELYDMDDQFKRVFHQAKIPHNDVRVPVFRSDRRIHFYLLSLPEHIQIKVQKEINRLGGSIVTCLSSATRIIFDPSRPTMNPEDDDALFTLLTAAVGGRILLHVDYIYECSKANRFLSIGAYNSYSTYELLHLNGPYLVAAKMSIKYRSDLRSGKFPAFYRSSVLFVGSKNDHVDVQILLQLLGAYVQPYNSNERDYPIYNPTINLIVTSRKRKLPSISSTVPRKTPDDVRRLLIDEYNKY